MKTQILQLEPHDDVISIRDKMSWGQTGRIVLIWPKHDRILTRRLDLVLLQRRSAALGAQLALVTHDTEVKSYAKELHIPVFKDLRQAQDQHWRTYRRRKLRLARSVPLPDFAAQRMEIHPQPPAWLTHPAVRLGFFTLGVLSFLFIASALLPGAELSLLPKTLLQATSVDIVASPDNTKISLSGEIPAHFTSIIIEGRDSISTTGSVQAPENDAVGYVQFTNLISETINLPKGTIVVTEKTAEQDPIRFETTRDGNVPGGTGKSLLLPVRALSPGLSGNLPPGSLVAMESSLGVNLGVTNLNATDGGTELPVRGPSPADYSHLQERLLATLNQAALSELSASLEPGDLPITSTLTLSDTLEKKYQPALEPGMMNPADQLDLSLRLEYKILVISGKNMRQLATRILDAGLPEAMRVLPEPLRIEVLTSPNVDKSFNVRLRMRASRNIQAIIDKKQAVQLTLGLPASTAGRILYNTLPLEALPTIQLTPSWWPRMPLLPFRIQINS